MKKDKEWFIKELLGHEIGDYGNYYNGGYEDGLAYALELAHQLDEPEVLSQEWIEENSYNRWMLEGTMDDEDETFVSSDDLQNLLVPKQELSVIPKIVADWYEENEGDLELEIFNLVTTLSEKGYDELTELEAWFNNLGNEPIETIMRMKLFGYEVEKEKLYIVQLPTDSEEDLIILAADGAIWKDAWPSRYKMTEKRIKEIDERYWPFAVEVAE